MKPLKKTALVAAISLASSTGAHAVAIYGDITALQMTLGTSDLIGNTQSDFDLAIGGTTEAVAITGWVTVFNAWNYTQMIWDLQGGIRQGTNGSGGTLFTAGSIVINTSTDGGNTYNYFDTIDVSTTNLPFLANQDGPIAPAPTQTTAGLVIDDAGYSTLPGLWDLVYFSDGWNNAVSSLSLFGNTGGLFMEGSVAPVPVPGAAWLFGSALLGLANLKRSRK